MKKNAATILAIFLGTTLAFGHHPEGGSTEGLFGLKAEYVHVLLNPLPVYGLSMAVVVLAVALLVRSKSAGNIGLVLIVICTASAWPVLFYGQHGYNHLYPQLDTESQQWLDVHMDRAERFVYAFYLTALLGIAALLTQKKLPRVTKTLTGLTLAAAVGSLGIGGWVSRAGGEVSHSEFRSDDAAPPASTEHHEHPMEMKMSNMSGIYQPGASNRPASKEEQMSNTPEGIWQAIHKHQVALESAVHNKKLDDIHPHAISIKELTKALVDVVHPDHKAAVQSGVDKINLAVSDLHQAAHADDQVAAEANLKRFDNVVRQLQEQMKKE